MGEKNQTEVGRKDSSGLTALIRGPTVRTCMGSKKNPCGAIEAYISENTKALISPGDYSEEELIENGHYHSHGILSRECYVRHFMDDLGVSEKRANEEADKLDWDYNRCPK